MNIPARQPDTGLSWSLELVQPQPRPSQPMERVFVGNQEATLLAPIVLVLIGNRFTIAAPVTVPGLMCHCDGDIDGHPRVVAVEVEPCGEDANGNKLYWDTGYVIEAPDSDSTDLRKSEVVL